MDGGQRDAEITTTANLTHPHILPLFDSGEADSFLFYVMPHIEGESLRDRIDREKQLPVDEAVALASKVAGALQHAHEHGVIHRDIKPGNILLQDGEPVVSDFGIALALGVAGGTRLTETGLSVGTPFYMSPEQATGDQAVGASTDTYALGSVLYEMLVGDPPFAGSTAQAVLGKIIAGKRVSATEERPSVPANVDAAIRKALEKLPADRFTSAQDFGKALGDENFRYGELATAGESAAVGPWNRLTMAFAGLAAVYTLGFAWSLLSPEPPEPPEPVARFALTFAEGPLPLASVTGLPPDFTADGSALVYEGPGPSGEGRQLWLRRWSDLDATPIRGTENGASPVLSPDEREVAFITGTLADGRLRVAPLDGGPSRTLVEQVFGVWDWTSDGFVYFTAAPPSAVISRVPATGGGSEAVESLTELLEGELAHILFSVLPGGQMGVFQVVGQGASTGEDLDVWAIDLETLERSFLTAGMTPRYASTGHLLFATPDGVLMRQRIDPATAELAGPAVPVLEDLTIGGGFAVYAISESGSLIYAAGKLEDAMADLTELVWVTRSGDATPVDPDWTFSPPPQNYGWSLSPDGSQVALTNVSDGNIDIWIKQLPDGPLERLTFDDADESYPVWTPDGQWVTYLRSESGNRDAWRRRADGTGGRSCCSTTSVACYRPGGAPTVSGWYFAQLRAPLRAWVYATSWGSDQEWIPPRCRWSRPQSS